MIIELKKNGNDGGAAGALDQIRRKQYFDSLTHYQGNLLFYGNRLRRKRENPYLQDGEIL